MTDKGSSNNPGSSLGTAAERLAARKPIPKPVPAYLPHPGSALAVDKQLYQTIQEAPRVLLEEFTLPIRSGRAWKASAGSIVRISTPEGPQVGESSRLGSWILQYPTSSRTSLIV